MPQVRPDVAITEGLLAAEPEVQARLVGAGEPPARLAVPLNGHFRWFGPARPAAEVSAHQGGAGGVEAGGCARGLPVHAWYGSSYSLPALRVHPPLPCPELRLYILLPHYSQPVVLQSTRRKGSSSRGGSRTTAAELPLLPTLPAHLCRCPGLCMEALSHVCGTPAGPPPHSPPVPDCVIFP